MYNRIVSAEAYRSVKLRQLDRITAVVVAINILVLVDKISRSIV